MALEKNLFPHHLPNRLSYLSLFSLSQFLCFYGKHICSFFPTTKVDFNCETKVGLGVFVFLVVEFIASIKGIWVTFFLLLSLVWQHIAVAKNMSSAVVVTGFKLVLAPYTSTFEDKFQQHISLCLILVLIYEIMVTT